MKGTPAVERADDAGDAGLLEPDRMAVEPSASDPAGFLREHAPRLKALLRSKSGASADDVEDALMDALEKAFKQWATIANPSAWVYRVAARHLSRQLRRNGNVVLVDDLNKIDTGVDDCTELVEAQERQRQLLQALTPEQHEAMVAALAGYSIADIAKGMKKTPTAVNGLLARGRKKLKKQLDHDDACLPGQRRPASAATTLGESDA